MKSLLDRVFDSTYTGLGKALDLTWRRNEAISSNIANAETPQYRSLDLHFGSELERAFKRAGTELKTTNTKHIDLASSGNAHMIENLGGATKADGNNVDIDIQMGQLAYNSGKYSSAARLMRKRLGILKYAIREGGR